MIIGAEVRKRRKELGMSQGDLAVASGVSQPTIASIEKDGQGSSKYLPQIARALKIEVFKLDPALSISIFGTLTLEAAGTAFEVMLETIRPDISPERAEALARIFLDLALEPPSEKISLALREQMRLRADILAKGFRPKPQ